MTTIKVNLNERSYPVFVGPGIARDLPARMKALGLGPDAVIVTNPTVRHLHGRALARALQQRGFTMKFFEVQDAEAAKSVKVAVGLIQKIVNYAAGKKIVVVAFGGGVVGDLAGFVAAVIRRGVPLVQVPTTLLAQVDSAIGGKTAVDLPQGKNLVGAFYQPRLVLADTTFLRTLDARHLRNGLAEVVKYGVIADKTLFAFVEKDFTKLCAADPRALARVVAASAKIKADVVSKDERETRGLRMILNFGHTVGHAVEAAAGFNRYHHGEAVALGMRVACAMSCGMKMMKPVDAARVECLLSAIGLPEEIRGVAFAKVLNAMTFDKKFSGTTNRFVLAKGIGRVVVWENVPARLIVSSLRSFF